MVRRILLGAALAAVVALTSGCDLSGTIDLSPGDSAYVDITISADGASCADMSIKELLGDAVTTTDASTPGTPACRLQGEVSIKTLSNYLPGSAFIPVGDRYVLVLNMAPFHDPAPEVALTVTMPGKVLSAVGGEVDGDQVRITDFESLDDGRLVVEAAGPDLNQWVWAVPIGVGVAVAALGIGVGYWLARRRRGAEPSGDAAARDATSASSESHSPVTQPEPDNSVWMPPVD